MKRMTASVRTTNLVTIVCELARLVFVSVVCLAVATGCSGSGSGPKKGEAGSFDSLTGTRSFKYNILFLADSEFGHADWAKPEYHNVLKNAADRWNTKVVDPDYPNLEDVCCNVDFSEGTVLVDQSGELARKYRVIDSETTQKNALKDTVAMGYQAFVFQENLFNYHQSFGNRSQYGIGMRNENLADGGLWAHEIGHNAGLGEWEDEKVGFPANLIECAPIMKHALSEPFTHRELVSQAEYKIMMQKQ